MSTKIYVGGLASETTENELNELFTGYGAVDSVVIIMDRSSGFMRYVVVSDTGGTVTHSSRGHLVDRPFDRVLTGQSPGAETLARGFTKVFSGRGVRERVSGVVDVIRNWPRR